MVKELETVYKAYEFTEEEANIAFIFTDMQLKHIQTELSVAAHERATLVESPDNPQRYICEQAFLRGKIEALQALINTHENTATDLQQRLLEAVEEQTQAKD